MRGAAENGAGSPLDRNLHIQGTANCRAFSLFPCCPSPQAITSPTKSGLLNLCNNSPSPLFHARKQKSLSQVKMDLKPLLGYGILKSCCSLCLSNQAHRALKSFVLSSLDRTTCSLYLIFKNTFFFPFHLYLMSSLFILEMLPCPG